MRRIPLSRRSHITGFQALSVSRAAQHESALERDFVTLTRFLDAAAQITSQPITFDFTMTSAAPVHAGLSRARERRRIGVHRGEVPGGSASNWQRLRPAFALRARGLVNTGQHFGLQQNAVFDGRCWRTPSGCCRCGQHHRRWDGGRSARGGARPFGAAFGELAECYPGPAPPGRSLAVDRAGDLRVDLTALRFNTCLSLP